MNRLLRSLRLILTPGYFLMSGFALLGINASAQTLTDGLMMPKNNLCTGLLYTNDQWRDYWEGDLKRDNGNIGRITTQSVTWFANYGIIDKLDVIVMVPYVKTQASQGTLMGMEGFQDISVGLKYNFYKYRTENINFSSFGAINVSTPLTDYTPDFMPLALGTHTTNINYRLTSYFRIKAGWFINASAGYTWRSNTKLDRDAYDDGTDYIISNEVKMPDMFDVFVSTGYHVGPLQAEVQYMQQNTLGGGDIKRQDMPFVSNRMNFQKGALLVMYYLPKPRGLAVRGSVQQVLAGRNWGQSTTFIGGLMYTIRFQQAAE